MTEAEWLACVDPQLMRRFLVGRLSERKSRLFDCACCRRIWHLLKDARSRKSVEIVERYADGLATQEDLQGARSEASNAEMDAVEAIRVLVFDSKPVAPHENTTSEAARAVLSATLSESGGWSAQPAAIAAEVEARGNEPEWTAFNRERAVQAHLFRDIVGNPFRPVIVASALLDWNDRTVQKLAQAIYDEVAFDRLPILADALEEASCDNADVLNHCRGEGPHVRGCWVVDLILQRE